MAPVFYRLFFGIKTSCGKVTRGNVTKFIAIRAKDEITTSLLRLGFLPLPSINQFQWFSMKQKFSVSKHHAPNLQAVALWQHLKSKMNELVSNYQKCFKLFSFSSRFFWHKKNVNFNGNTMIFDDVCKRCCNMNFWLTILSKSWNFSFDIWWF